MLELLIAKDLGAIDPTWAGWSFRGQDLVTPEGSPVRPGDIRAIPYRQLQLSDLERRLQQPQQWELFSS